MIPSRRHLALLVGMGLLQGCATPGARSRDPVSEVREFMEQYARDLRAGDREAVSARYDPRGAWIVGHGEKRLVSLDSIRLRYLEQWQPPRGFEWHDLSYEVVGPAAVVVAGRFDWTDQTGALLPVSYTALLVRSGEGWRIRLEDESVAPAAMKARLCAPGADGDDPPPLQGERRGRADAAAES